MVSFSHIIVENGQVSYLSFVFLGHVIITLKVFMFQSTNWSFVGLNSTNVALPSYYSKILKVPESPYHFLLT